MHTRRMLKKIKNNGRLFVIIFFFGNCGLVSCESVKDMPYIDSGTDADADTDTDSDVDSDTDTDTDSDVDTDSDADTDADTDSDSDADTGGDSDADTDADSDADTDADTDSDGDSDADTDADTDSDGDSDTDTNADTDSDGDADTDTDTVIDTESESETAVTCDSNPCDENAICTEQGNGVTCTCKDGWEGDGEDCDNINECQNESHDCDKDHGTCEDTPGSFLCGCRNGWELAADEKNCVDVDECAENLDDCNADIETCVDIDGSYNCECIHESCNSCCQPDQVCHQTSGSCCTPQSCEEDGAIYQNDGCGNTINCGPWVSIRGGSFMMGIDRWAYDKAEPPHPVTVPDFEIWRTEITVAQYLECLESGHCTAPAGNSTNDQFNWGNSGPKTDRMNHPVNNVSWIQARTFCTWAGGKLPTEAEWEYVTTNNGQDKYPWGDADVNCVWAIYAASDLGCGCGVCHTREVCSCSPYGDNQDGLCDLIGNVWEWVEDDAHELSDDENAGGYDPNGDGIVDAPSDGSAWIDEPRAAERILRGESYINALSPDVYWSHNRVWNSPNFDYETIGFRCAK